MRWRDERFERLEPTVSFRARSVALCESKSELSLEPKTISYREIEGGSSIVLCISTLGTE